MIKPNNLLPQNSPQTDLDHWCSCNGIAGSKKADLMSILWSIISEELSRLETSPPSSFQDALKQMINRQKGEIYGNQ